MKIVKIKENIERRTEDGEGLLFDPETGGMFVINDTGIWLWDQVEEGMSLADLLSRAQAQFSLTAEQLPEVADQVVDYLLQLYFRKLLQLEVAGRELT